MRLTIPVIALTILAGPAYTADTAAERREELAQIRERIGDPDPLMRLAYLEELAKLQDQTAIQFAVRYALASDDMDLRALALRLYMANAKSLDLKVLPPQKLQQTVADAKQARGLNKRLLSLMEAGYLRFRVENFDFQTSSFKVFAMNRLNAPSEVYSGPGQVRGATISFSSVVFGFPGAPRCTVTLQPTPDLSLTGEAACETGRAYPTIPVNMPMF